MHIIFIQSSKKIGLLNTKALSSLDKKNKETSSLVSFLQKETVSPEKINLTLSSLGESNISESVKIAQLLKRPSVKITDFDLSYFKKIKSSSPSHFEEILFEIILEIKFIYPNKR